ncbi:hypothetical protein FS935_05990 [Metabacillus litoralis]|uniref:Uncharacterized protein n=1 Tax=Metabacillus litoralis TaxID=152268 RepID=A0A5C6W4V7_9BACI|nr:hypothetical protein [Metabacillus litoralis]TXC91932.1 hypothetical protein FS935_05990 [Metabacillus litoralis]
MKYSTMKSLTDNQRKILEDTENSMTSFLIEMKDENDRLIEQLTNNSSLIPQEVAPKDNKNAKVNNIAAKASSYDIDKMKKSKKEENENENEDEGLPKHLSQIDEVKDTIEISESTLAEIETLPFEIEAINLYENGYSIEQIARKFNKGKTEVELILKFRQ